MPQFDLADYVAKYRKLRDAKKQIEERHKLELAPINEMLAKCDAVLLQYLRDQNSESVKTSGGTVYRTTKWSASVKDWEAVLAHIRRNKLWHVLNRSVSMTAARSEFEADKPIPGVELNSFDTVGVRKPERKD